MNSAPFGQLKSLEKILGSIWKPGIWPTARDFPPDEAIFSQEYFVYCKENGAQQAEKTRCLGVLTVFR